MRWIGDGYKYECYKRWVKLGIIQNKEIKTFYIIVWWVKIYVDVS